MLKQKELELALESAKKQGEEQRRKNDFTNTQIEQDAKKRQEVSYSFNYDWFFLTGKSLICSCLLSFLCLCLLLLLLLL